MKDQDQGHQVELEERDQDPKVQVQIQLRRNNVLQKCVVQHHELQNQARDCQSHKKYVKKKKLWIRFLIFLQFFIIILGKSRSIGIKGNVRERKRGS